MAYDILEISLDRQVTLCGMNVHLMPEYHPDRTLNDYDLLYIAEGEWTLTQEDETYLLKAGDAILLRAGCRHWSPVVCAPGTRTLYVHFNRLPGDTQMRNIGAGALSPREVCLSTVINCQRTDAPDYMRRIIDLYWSERPDKKILETLYVNMLLTEMAHVVLKSHQPDADKWIVSILRLFRSEPGVNYTLQQLAEHAGVSVRTLSERFKRVTGQTVHQYQLNMKLEMAYTAIRYTNRTLHDIATDFGFYDAYQFSRLFKRKYGKSPMHYRMHDPSVNISRPQY